ncbi:MAG: DUF4012 domain-containing protein [Clostridiales bacterium]|nr:DUF4012 domain-containing protein [Clostridiales bacterium]
MEIRHQMMKNTTNTNKANRKPVKLVVLLVVLAVVVAGLAFGGYQAFIYYNEATTLARQAEDLKKEVKLLVTHVEKGNYEAANLSVEKIDNLSAQMRTTISDKRWQLVQEKAPKYGEDLKTASAFLDVVDEASNTILKPGVKFLREKGLPSKATFSKIDPELGKTLNAYADLIDELAPAVEKVLEDFNKLPTFQIDKLESKVSKYRALAKDNGDDIVTYLRFAKKTSDTFVRPVAKFLIDNGSALKIDVDMDKVGPELSNQISILADGIDQLTPIVEKTLKEFNTLPEFKIDKVENKLSKYRKLAKDSEADIISLLKFAREISSGVMRPAAAVMTRSPISKLKTESGDIDSKIIRDYLSLVETAKPYLGRIKEFLKTNKLLKDHQKQLVKVTAKLDKAENLLKEYDAYVPYIDILLGDGSDRTYLLVAQNSAEMRAAGGLPASIGTVTIKDGIIKIGKFLPYTKVLPFYNKGIKQPFTKVEKEIFYEGWYCKKLTAATVNPHFPKAAQLLANGYKKMHGKKIDGIISMTPAIVGRLMSITGPIKLSNGVKLDEKYSVKYLQRDVYFQYFTKKTMSNQKLHDKANDKTNEMFAEAAKKVISGVMSNLDLKTIMKLLDIIKQSSEDRVFQMWMADSALEEKVKSLGCSGSLNYDPQNPKIGVYFNIRDANRLGNYVDIKVTMGKEKVNKDGSVTYPVTVKLKNNIDSKTIRDGGTSGYLTSHHGGTMRSIIYFFAPSGGKISSFKNNSKLESRKTKYQNLNLYWCPLFELKPKKTVTFTYKVTTAPGVNVKPKIDMTPLLTAYRNAKAPK